MNIAIVEDRTDETEELKALLSCYEEEKDVSFSVECFRSGEEFLEHFEVSRFAIIFMDIFMDGMNGTDTARQIRNLDPVCIIVFLTGSSEFMPQAFSCHAFDYIQKPPSKERIFQALSDALLTFPQPVRRLEFICSRRLVKLPYADIVCAVANGHNTDITDKNGNAFSPHKSFSELIRPLLEDKRFLQINRGVLVNMDHILEFDERACHLIGGIALPVRVRERTQIQAAWQDYMFARIHSDFQKGTAPYDVK